MRYSVKRNLRICQEARRAQELRAFERRLERPATPVPTPAPEQPKAEQRK